MANTKRFDGAGDGRRGRDDNRTRNFARGKSGYKPTLRRKGDMLVNCTSSYTLAFVRGTTRREADKVAIRAAVSEFLDDDYYGAMETEHWDD